MGEHWLVLYDGWAIIGICGVFYFVIDTLICLHKWYETRKWKKKHWFISLSETADKYKWYAKYCGDKELANEYMAIRAWLIELRNRRMEEDMDVCYNELKSEKDDEQRDETV